MPYPFSINKPFTGTLSDKEDIYDKYDYLLTPKKMFIRVVLILLISLLVLGESYYLLFVADFEKVPAEGISVSDVYISDNLLYFTLRSADCNLTGSFDYKIKENGNENAIAYFNVYKPIISGKLSHKQAGTDLSTKIYDMDIRGISSVYYTGDDPDDKVLIWKK